MGCAARFWRADDPSRCGYLLRPVQESLGQTRRMALGRHGRLTVDQARKIAGEKLAAVAAGRDPVEEKRAARVAAERPDTVEAVAQRWIEFQRARVTRGRLRDRTLGEYVRQVRREIVPRLGPRCCGDLTAADAQRLHDELSARPILANRVVSLLAQLWRWAAAHGECSGINPCAAVERHEERRRERHLTRGQLELLGASLRRLTTEGKIAPRIAPMVRLIALTGCRPGEVKGLPWDSVDLDRRVLRLRDAKTGDRDVWLNAAALATLRALDRPNNSPWVFPSPREPRRPQGEFRKPWRALLRAAGIWHVEPYVLRHTFASESEALGNSVFMTAALLGHSIGRREMTHRYVHHVPDEVRRASERVGSRIAAALDRAIVPAILSNRSAAGCDGRRSVVSDGSELNRGFKPKPRETSSESSEKIPEH